MNNFLESIKNKVYLVGDIGSCHNGKLEYALEAVEMAKECGLDSIKFQLGVSYPNIDLPFKDFVKCFEKGKEIGIDVTASVFGINTGYEKDTEVFYNYLNLKPAWIKFAYIQRSKIEYQSCSDACEIPVVCSCDIMTYEEPINNCIKLFCISEYPVKYLIDFEGLFDKFYGFSDHTTGHLQTCEAIAMGARWIEKHIRLDHCDINCPDSRFAIRPNRLKYMVERIREMEKAIMEDK